jgi:predicted TPR repeat methyltransferase
MTMLDQGATAPQQALATRLHAGARQMVRQQRPAEALPMIDRLARLPGLDGPAAILRAEALAALGQLPEAEAAADRALATDPAWSAALQLRGSIRLARGQCPGAIEDAAAAVMATPWDPGAKILLGNALLEGRRFDEAIWFLGGALQADPSNHGHQLTLGRAFMMAGRHAAADEILAHCLATAGDLPGLAALQAQNSLLAGNPGGAVALARDALARGVNGAALHSILAHALVADGKLAEAAPHFIAAARLAPQDGYLAHLAAAANGSGTERATDSYIASLFDGYASRFEDSLLSLGYQVPGLIRQAVERQWPAVAVGEAKLGPVLDLGCGTGFIGVALSDMLGGPLTGIDLSRGMLAQAAAKGLYACLQQAEIGAALRLEMPPQALVVAADVFIYFGRLDEVLALCRQRLAPDGLLMFSVERIAPGEPAGEGWRLGGSGRYAHADGYVASCLADAGLTILEWREETVRLDAAGPVAGLVVVARADMPRPAVH